MRGGLNELNDVPADPVDGSGFEPGGEKQMVDKNQAHGLWLVAALVFLAGCGESGGRSDILGPFSGATAPPTVTTVSPVHNSGGVSPLDPGIRATFSEAMSALASSAASSSSFTVTCASPCTNAVGTVSLNAANTVATFTLAPGVELEEDTLYTATITGAVSLSTGLVLAEPKSWSFTAAARPRVTGVAPVNDATGVPVNTRVITSGFTEPVAPLTGDASFTVTCSAPCTNPVGSVALDASSETAMFTLEPATLLKMNTLYTATVTAAESLETGLAMASPYVWSFTTGLVRDTTRPRVDATQPRTTSPGPTPDVPVNTSVTASFTEDMVPPTSTGAGTFTLTCSAPCTPPNGSVRYAVGSRTDGFSLTPVGEELEPGTTYTARISSAVTDLAGNALAGNQALLPAASDYVWTFTTVSDVAAPPAAVTVNSVTPADADIGVCPNKSINVAFDVSSGLQMDPRTINALTFTVAETDNPTNMVTASSVVFDGANGIATLMPATDLVDGTEYTVTVKGGTNGVKDLAVPANAMADDFVWRFTAGPATGECLQPVSLRSAVPFGILACSTGMTNQGILTIVNGDLGSTTTASLIKGFRDSNGDVYRVTSANDGTVNGKIFSCITSTSGPTSQVFGVNAANCNAATVARDDAINAFNELAGLPGGPDPASGSGAGNLGNKVLTPGVYTSAGGSFRIQGGDLTLDARGDSNATWVFQMATSLTVGGPGADAPQSIILLNGAQAKNVFWQVGSSAIVNAAGGGTMVGTIIAATTIAISTPGKVDVVTLNGRAMSLEDSVTIVNTIINVPAP